jgi:hypothetical protein
MRPAGLFHNPQIVQAKFADGAVLVEVRCDLAKPECRGVMLLVNAHSVAGCAVKRRRVQGGNGTTGALMATTVRLLFSPQQT